MDISWSGTDCTITLDDTNFILLRLSTLQFDTLERSVLLRFGETTSADGVDVFSISPIETHIVLSERAYKSLDHFHFAVGHSSQQRVWLRVRQTEFREAAVA
jgi:hypothetical protein